MKNFVKMLITNVPVAIFKKPFKSLKKKKEELARIIDKKKIYRVDVELDPIMTRFKISFANIRGYLLDEYDNGERMALELLFETIGELRGTVEVEKDRRNIVIARTPKLNRTGLYVMCKNKRRLNNPKFKPKNFGDS